MLTQYGKKVRKMIMHEKNLIFVHVPKTGGSTIIHTLLGIDKLTQLSKHKRTQYGIEGALRHRSALQIQQRVGDEIWNAYYKFAFVRTPWERMVSAYFWNQREGNKQYALNISFEEFIKKLPNILDSENCPLLRHCRPQTFFLTSPNGEIMVNDVFRYEDFSASLEIIGSKIGSPFKPSKKYKVSKHKRYIKYYTTTTKNIVRRCYADDIQLFNYKFQ